MNRNCLRGDGRGQAARTGPIEDGWRWHRDGMVHGLHEDKMALHTNPECTIRVVQRSREYLGGG